MEEVDRWSTSRSRRWGSVDALQTRNGEERRGRLSQRVKAHLTQARFTAAGDLDSGVAKRRLRRLARIVSVASLDGCWA